jgi:hypothetical protein
MSAAPYPDNVWETANAANEEELVGFITAELGEDVIQDFLVDYIKESIDRGTACSVRDFTLYMYHTLHLDDVHIPE